jgi:branched-chain amino acid transport system permease protein
MTTHIFVQSLTSGLTQGCIYALIGLGFTIIFNVTGIINFAQGEFAMLGGMLSFYFTRSAGFPIVPALLVSVLITALIGAALYLLTIRTARRASVVSLIIITIGAAILIRGIAAEIWGVNPISTPAFTGKPPLHFLGATIQPQALWIIGITLASAVVLHFLFSSTVIGKALRACSMNRSAARLVGIDPRMMALIAFALAAALGALGGVVVAPLSFWSYDKGVSLGLNGFVAASMGGFKSQTAVIAGGIVLGVVEHVAIAIDWGPFKSDYKEAIALVLLLLILVVRSRKLSEEERVS